MVKIFDYSRYGETIDIPDSMADERSAQVLAINDDSEDYLLKKSHVKTKKEIYDLIVAHNPKVVRIFYNDITTYDYDVTFWRE